MIYRLQRRFILISAVSVLTVVALVFAVTFALNVSTMNGNLDILADTVSEGGGRFPDRFHEAPPPQKGGPGDRNFDFITPETPFSTRHFTVLFDSDGRVARTNTESIFSITQEAAVSYAEKALGGGRERGWLEHYRYKIFDTEAGRGVVFIDGSMSRASLMQSMTIAGFVLFACAALVLLLIVLLSKRAVKPIAESYEKQKQFITDANHELKTPLTLILANLDIAEAELGKNEWLDDIRSEGYRMEGLVGQLVALSRMDEERQELNLSELDISDLVLDGASEFSPLSERKGLRFSVHAEPGIRYRGDETLLRRLLSVLLENAVKYCDAGGEIRVALRCGRHIELTVENTYAAVGETALPRLFDRFYRTDQARSFTGGYGVGLSMAKAIVDHHKGEITAYKKDATHIGFRVTL